MNKQIALISAVYFTQGLESPSEHAAMCLRAQFFIPPCWFPAASISCTISLLLTAYLLSSISLISMTYIEGPYSVRRPYHQYHLIFSPSQLSRLPQIPTTPDPRHSNSKPTIHIILLSLNLDMHSISKTAVYVAAIVLILRILVPVNYTKYPGGGYSLTRDPVTSVAYYYNHPQTVNQIGVFNKLQTEGTTNVGAVNGDRERTESAQRTLGHSTGSEKRVGAVGTIEAKSSEEGDDAEVK